MEEGWVHSCKKKAMFDRFTSTEYVWGTGICILQSVNKGGGSTIISHGAGGGAIAEESTNPPGNK